MKRLLSILLVVGCLLGLSYDPGILRFDVRVTKSPDEASFAVFLGTPSIEASLRDFTDNVSYRKVKATGAAEDGGLVYEFIIPEGVTAIAEIKLIGKSNDDVADVIDVEVKEMDFNGDNVTSLETDLAAIASLTKTVHTITSFSVSPTLIAGDLIVVEIKANIAADARAVSLGPCAIKWDR